MTDLKPMDRLIWTDIETTGLDKEKEVLLEVGFRVTDLELKYVKGFSALIWMPNYSFKIAHADDFVKKMHAKNVLFEDAEEHGKPIDQVGADLLKWATKLGVTKEDPLCGSSVQFDREWLTYLFPEVMDLFSYRNIDNSSVKELCRRYNPVLYDKLEEDTKPQKIHRVAPDLTDTINEAKFYLDNFLWVA